MRAVLLFQTRVNSVFAPEDWYCTQRIRLRQILTAGALLWFHDEAVAGVDS